MNIKSFIKTFALLIVLYPGILAGQKNVAAKLKKPEQQTIVVYGASVAATTSTRIWVDELFGRLDKRYPGKLTCYNISKSGVNSFWATENFKDSVLSKKPDILIFGFCENDCVERFNFWPWYSGKCAEYMIDNLKKQNPEAIVIMYIMSEFPIENAATTRPEIKAFNDSYREVAKKRNVLLVDFSKEFKDIYEIEGEKVFRSYQGDGILPSKKAAYEVIVPGFLKAMGIK